MSGLCDINNIGNIWCQFGKEWNGNSCTDPAADVTHQHWVLIKDTNNIWSHKPVFDINSKSQKQTNMNETVHNKKKKRIVVSSCKSGSLDLSWNCVK